MKWPSLLTYRRRVLTTRLAVLAGFAALLEVAPRAGWVDQLTLVPLTTMIDTLADGLRTDALWTNLAYTGGTVLASFLGATLIGIFCGYLLWTRPSVRRALEPYLTSYYALPVFAFYPVLVAIFGLNRTPVIVLATAYAVVAIVTNTVVGFDAVKPVHLKAARVLGLGYWATLLRVQLPSAAPYVFTGLRLGVSYAVIGVIASEFILSTRGLGWLVSYQYNGFDLAGMYSSIVLIMLLAITITGLLGLAERRWHHEGARR